MNILVALIFAVPAPVQGAPEPGASSGFVAAAMPAEVVIKGEGVSQLGGVKPPLQIAVDEFETIRDDLRPDPALLLSASPLAAAWRSTHPEFLMNERVIQPWRLPFSQRAGVSLRVREQLEGLLGTRLDDAAARPWGWSLTLADEEGRVFHHAEGAKNPPVEIVWSGRSDAGEWVRAGRSYSAVYAFTGPDGAPRTSVGKPLLWKGVVHQEDTGLYLSLDSSALFGTDRAASDVQAPVGTDLLRSAADLVKRRYAGIPISVRAFADTKELGAAQAAGIRDFLLREFMIAPRNVAIDSARAPFSDQRVEIVLLNR
ncbi:MAG: hypothetical protein HY552_05920 [Elusimicrobia bacterium]|nr:hypothetical protein [Elusimicrobiota bacterium]